MSLPSSSKIWNESGAMTRVKGRSRRRVSDFQPDQEYITDAIVDYLDAGGKITRVVIDECVEVATGYKDADFFLRGE